MLLTALGALSVAIPLAANASWLAELTTHFRAQYAAACGAALVAGVALRQFDCASLLAACTLFNVWPLLPYLSKAAAAPSPREGVSILSANVHATNRDARPLIALITERRPDLFLILEYTPRFDQALAVLRAEYPYSLRAPAEGPFGIGFYSRLPLADPKLFQLGATDAVRASITGENGSLDFIGVHLQSPINAELAAVRNRQIEALAVLVAADPGRTVACGDYNLSSYSPYFSRLLDESGLADPRVGRGLARTWPVGNPALGIPIDHCLIGGDLEVKEVQTLGDIGSDHYPVLIEITGRTKR